MAGLVANGNEEAARLRRLLVDLQQPSFADDWAPDADDSLDGLNPGQQEAIRR